MTTIKKYQADLTIAFNALSQIWYQLTKTASFEQENCFRVKFNYLYRNNFPMELQLTAQRGTNKKAWFSYHRGSWQQTWQFPRASHFRTPSWQTEYCRFPSPSNCLRPYWGSSVGQDVQYLDQTVPLPTWYLRGRPSSLYTPVAWHMPVKIDSSKPEEHCWWLVLPHAG